MVANFQSVKNKKVELAQVASTYNPEVILGTETWLNNEIQSSEIFPQNYTAFRRDRKDGFGGVVIVTRNDLICEEIVNVNINTESIYCKIELQGNKSVVVGVVYRPPNSNTDYMRMVCEEMEEIRRKHRNAVLWIGGDFNLPDINWSTLDIQGIANANAINQSFIDMTSNIGLEQQVNFPTRGEAILDLFLTNRPSLVEKCASLPSLGDHDVVMIKTSAAAKRAKPVRRKVYLWKKADIDKMTSEAEKFATSVTNKYDLSSEIEEMWKEIKDGIMRLQEECVPSKMTSTRYNQPWVNREVKRKAQQKKRCYMKAKETGKAKDWERFHLKKREMKAA